MDENGSTLERLRLALADLESAQLATGTTACADFFEATPPDAAGSVPQTPSPDAVGPGPDASSAFQHGQVAPRFAAAAAAAKLAPTDPTALAEADLVESVTQLGLVQRAKEVSLVRLVAEMESRGVASPGGLSRVDWLRQVDPTLEPLQAKAIVTCANAFAEPRWEHLRDQVISADPGEARVTVGKAAHVIDFHDRLRRLLTLTSWTLRSPT